jgi:hypothetical protein
MTFDKYSKRTRLWRVALVGMSLSPFLTTNAGIASHKPDEKNKHDSVSVQVVFGERDREIIRDYCSQPHSNLPPGLAKRGGNLPPGLEKQLRRNGQLPPGLQKKVQRFPYELERRLPPLPGNYVRVFLEGRGMIVDAQFNIIDLIDIFRK